MSERVENSYSVRQATANDWQAWKNIRLEALQTDPQFFGSTYEKESQLAQEDWLRGVTNPRRGSFLLCHDDQIIGLTAIGLLEHDDEKAALYASFIRKEHRGQGLSQLLYQARLNWAYENGVKQIAVSHRKGNDASKAANQKFGFKYSHDEMKIWHDGKEEIQIWYLLELEPSQKPAAKNKLTP